MRQGFVVGCVSRFERPQLPSEKHFGLSLFLTSVPLSFMSNANDNKNSVPTTRQKALRINLDSRIYGTFAEIGAGQEVAAYFFKAGAASGTIAKTMSAYDMAFSDAIYGAEKSGRYVCESRVLKMVNYEYDLVEERLKEKRPDTCFFAFANTVEVLNFMKTNRGHGWLALKFQLRPSSKPNELVIHVNLLDNHKFLQEQAIGILGVNMMYACYYYHDDPDLMLTSLMDNLTRDRVEVDMFRIVGEDFGHVDNRLMSLRLVKNGMSNAAMFDPDGNVLQPSEALYKKNILALRGRFRPVTHVNVNMLECGKRAFLAEKDVNQDDVLVLTELTLNNLRAEGQIDEQDFLDRVDILCSLGNTVMISNYQEYYRLVEFLSLFTRGKKIGIVLGIYSLGDVFEEKFYTHLRGGILEAFGKLFGQNVKLYVYPSRIPGTNELLGCENFEVPEKQASLFKYLLDNDQLATLKDANPDILHIFSDNVLDMIRQGKEGWEQMVPDKVAQAIQLKCLFGYPCPVDKMEKVRSIREAEQKEREARQRETLEREA
jgi:hypothetical protein